MSTYHYARSSTGIWHRVTVTDNVKRSGERCNLDDAKVRATQTFEPPYGERRCKWCYR
jgi:hypothetical protein